MARPEDLLVKLKEGFHEAAKCAFGRRAPSARNSGAKPRESSVSSRPAFTPNTFENASRSFQDSLVSITRTSSTRTSGLESEAIG